MIIYEAVVEEYLITVYDDGRWKAEREGLLVSYGITDNSWKAKHQAVEDVLQRIGRSKTSKTLQDLEWIKRTEDR